MQTSDENKYKYQSGDYYSIQNQIPQTNITRIVWQTIRRITIEILGEKRVKRIDELVDFHLCKLCHFLHNRKIVKIVKFAKLIPF